MPKHPPPPYDPWLTLQAWQQTWLAGLDPNGIGRALREERVARLIDRAVRDSPLYARRAGSARRLGDFDPIGKRELMAHFDDWATDRRITRRAAEAHLQTADSADGWLGRYLLWTSSGTSGQPGLFVQDAASLAAYDALDALRLRPGGWLPQALGPWGPVRRFAYVGAIGGPYAGHVNLLRLQRIVPPPWTPRVERLSVLQPLADIARQLEALQPQILITYPSCAAALAEAQAEGEMKLSLEEVWLGGEQLSAAQRDRVGGVFGCPVRNCYGASEFYSMAFECTQGRLHLNDDWVVLEGVDADGRPVPHGEFSHTTLLTNLANHTQPLLRYELTDRVRFDPEPCPCGRSLPVIEVQGRGDDVLRLRGQGSAPAVLLPLALETILEEEAGVTRFQLLLHSDEWLELRLAPEDSHSARAFDRCRAALDRHLLRQGIRGMRVQRSACPPALQTGSGKLRRVVDLRAAGSRDPGGAPA